jgi:hypothetical protein
LNIFLPSESFSKSDITNYEKKSGDEEADFVMQGRDRGRGQRGRHSHRHPQSQSFRQTEKPKPV